MVCHFFTVVASLNIHFGLLHLVEHTLGEIPRDRDAPRRVENVSPVQAGFVGAGGKFYDFP